MEILFTNPPFVEEVDGHMRYGINAGSRWPWSSQDVASDYIPFPFFMAYAVSMLKQAGADVDLYDSVAVQEFNYESYYQHIKEMNPKIIVIETSTPTIHLNLQVAERLSQIIPSVEIALCGPHATVFAEELIKLPYITYILKGEYELNSIVMWQTKHPGIYEYISIDDIDSSPYPYRDPKVINNYWDQSMDPHRPQLQIYASRGCPYSCVYCMWPPVMYKGKYRARSAMAVANEIRYCVDSFDSRSIFFDDDTFNLGNERISILCDELKKIGLPWSMMGRTDTSPLWLFDKMIDCGCTGFRFGIETFSERIQKVINKKLNPKIAIEVLSYLSTKYPQVKIRLTTIKGLPTETEEDRQYNVKIITDLGFDGHFCPHTHQCATCIPFPGTPLYDSLKEQGHGEALKDFSMYDGDPNKSNTLTKLITEMKE